MLENIKKEVYEANMDLLNYNLVILTWGNVSARVHDYIIIKPSGIQYKKMSFNDMVIIDLDGNIVEGKYKPSSDALTHIELYKAFPGIKGVAHTHSDYATSFAQAGKSIECYGTTQADYFYGSIPCTRNLKQKEVEINYEKNTGKVIAETFTNKDYEAIPGVLVNSHGVFTWGNSAKEAVYNAVIVEKIAKINFQTLILNKNKKHILNYILDKHYWRKHGENAYYGQK